MKVQLLVLSFLFIITTLIAIIFLHGISDPVRIYIYGINHDENSTRYNTFKEAGDRLLSMGKYELAIQVLNLAIKFNNTGIDAYLNKAYALSQLKNYTEANEAYDKVIEIDPNNHESYHYKGWNLNYLGDMRGSYLDAILRNYTEEYERIYTQAIAMFDKALEIDPKDKYSYNGKGYALNKLDKYNQAIAMYDKALEIDPLFQPAYHNKGTALNLIGNHTQAIAMFNKALEIDPKDATSLRGKASAYYNLGNITEAIRNYALSLHFDPTNERALERLSDIFWSKIKHE
ncbi:MAG: tetratricopeptide repeat protein [Candidatus Nitrosocosmicus sp.]